MTSENLQYGFALAIGIIGYFLRRLMSELDGMKSEVVEHDKEIGIIKAEQNNIYKRFDKLDKNFETISTKIDNVLMKLNDQH